MTNQSMPCLATALVVLEEASRAGAEVTFFPGGDVVSVVLRSTVGGALLSTSKLLQLDDQTSEGVRAILQEMQSRLTAPIPWP